ncbi:MAG: hypothetical protein U0031_00145 [Thermomicrobiales bacterium]
MSAVAPVVASAPPLSGREALLQRYERAVDPLMVALGLNFLILIVIDYAGLPLSDVERNWLHVANLVIYAFFLLDAAIRLVLNPHRVVWLRHNIFLVIALVLPLLLPFDRRLTTPISIAVRLAVLFWGGVRGLDALRTVSRGQVFYFLILLTTFVTLIGAAGVLALEHGWSQSQITTYGASLWWAATLITTVNSGLDPVSPWGRVVAVLMRIYAVGFFSYLTANLASLFVSHFKTSETDSKKS